MTGVDERRAATAVEPAPASESLTREALDRLFEELRSWRRGTGLPINPIAVV